jgi:hypothetical protein
MKRTTEAFIEGTIILLACISAVAVYFMMFGE